MAVLTVHFLNQEVAERPPFRERNAYGDSDNVLMFLRDFFNQFLLDQDDLSCLRIEFTFKYVSGAPDEPKEHLLGKFCKDHNINHKLIPPGEKELQGLVERSHRQDDQELFSRIKPNELDQFNKLLEEYANERNQNRRFKKLNWKTPNQWLNDYLVKALATTLFMDSQKNAEGNFSRGSSEAKILEIKKKFKEDEKAKNGASIRKLAA